MEINWKFDAWDTFHEKMFSAEFLSVNWSGLTAGLFLGVVLLTCVFSAASFGVLRQRYLLWYSARCIAIGVLALMLSPVYLGPFFEHDSMARHTIGYFAFDLMVALVGPFLAAYLEPDAIPDRLRRALFWAFPFALMFAPVFWMTEPPAAYYFGRLVAYLGILVLLIVSVAVAVRRKSRTARFQLAGWAPILALNIVNLPYHIATGNPLPQFLTLLFVSLGIEFVVTALGITDRFMTLRRQRDRAEMREEMLLALAQTDPLTGLANRRGLENAYGPDVTALALFDLDRFKAINDTFGHDIGDRVLVHTADALGAASGLAARLGGEEFAVLFFSDDPAREAEALREAISEQATDVQPGLIVTASAGLVMVTGDRDLREVLREADALLYEAKEQGRNRLIARVDRRREERAIKVAA
ncbi:GGDEF domain-containing protein [Erythrobacter rubeus]|uniref:diguanylate cyclase n=1 Tax=Erythrobacter rubeus TaxID=2760803 RepID=A0ABR8KNA1_9SPHN|nr:diguanylate cyclase [Erythrobacter rubeus]MBD2842102.1 diguanylate cyclase [Erythrobacter rubeus]